MCLGLMDARLDVARPEPGLRDIGDNEGWTGDGVESGAVQHRQRQALRRAGRSDRGPARRRLRVRSTWQTVGFGAAGPGSFDCSGLTMAAWGAIGVSLRTLWRASTTSAPTSRQSSYGLATWSSCTARLATSPSTSVAACSSRPATRRERQDRAPGVHDGRLRRRRPASDEPRSRTAPTSGTDYWRERVTQ